MSMDAVKILGSKLTTLELRLSEQQKRKPFRGLLWIFDPGVTTGYVKYRMEYDQPHCWIIADQERYDTIAGAARWLVNEIEKPDNKPDIIVLEDYRVFAWKSEDHIWNPLYTARIIGCIETIAGLHRIPIIKQTPQNAKNFAKDDLLKQLELYKPTAGIRHARDALRHLVFFLLANAKNHSPSFDEQQTSLLFDPNEDPDWK